MFGDAITVLRFAAASRHARVVVWHRGQCLLGHAREASEFFANSILLLLDDVVQGLELCVSFNF